MGMKGKACIFLKPFSNRDLIFSALKGTNDRATVADPNSGERALMLWKKLSCLVWPMLADSPDSWPYFSHVGSVTQIPQTILIFAPNQELGGSKYIDCLGVPEDGVGNRILV